jgi:translation initiation factor 5A
MSLMTDNGDTKDDVKVPDNEVGDKIKQMFQVEEKECSKLRFVQLLQIITDSL